MIGVGGWTFQRMAEDATDGLRREEKRAAGQRGRLRRGRGAEWVDVDAVERERHGEERQPQW